MAIRSKVVTLQLHLSDSHAHLRSLEMTHLRSGVQRAMVASAFHPVLRSRPPAWEAAFGSDGGRIACGGFRARFKKRVSGAMGNPECFRRLVRS